MKGGKDLRIILGSPHVWNIISLKGSELQEESHTQDKTRPKIQHCTVIILSAFYHLKKKPFIIHNIIIHTVIQKHCCFFWSTKEIVLWPDNFEICLEKSKHLSGWTGKGPSCLLSANSSKASIDDGIRGISAHDKGSLHICKDTNNAKSYIQVLEQHLLPSKTMSISQKPLSYFSKSRTATLWKRLMLNKDKHDKRD